MRRKMMQAGGGDQITVEMSRAWGKEIKASTTGKVTNL